MSLMSELNKMIRFNQNNDKSLNASYDSRARFVRNQTAQLHGLGRRNAYYGYRHNRSRHDDEPNIFFSLPDEIRYMQRRRDNSVLMNKTSEIRYLDKDTLLLRATCELHPMVSRPDSSGRNRWSYTQEDATHSLEVSNEALKTTVKTYLIRVEDGMELQLNDEDAPSRLYLGANGQAQMTLTESRVVLEDSEGSIVTCIELQGANVGLWETNSAELIEHILNPQVREYISPVFETLGFEDIWDNARDAGKEEIIIGGLHFHRIGDATKINSDGGKLADALDIKSVVIKCNIMKGTILTFNENGRTVSKDVEQGVYNILTYHEHSNLKEYREEVLLGAHDITVNFAVSRLDYLTVFEVEKGSTNVDTSLEGRVHAADVDVKKSKENVNTDELVSRISIVNFDED